jgi:hypothetical protein
MDAKKQLGWTYCSQGQWRLCANDMAGLIVVKDNGTWMQVQPSCFFASIYHCPLL